MFAGHVGVGLAIGRAERRVNLGLLVTLAVVCALFSWLGRAPRTQAANRRRAP